MMLKLILHDLNWLADHAVKLNIKKWTGNNVLLQNYIKGATAASNVKDFFLKILK